MTGQTPAECRSLRPVIPRARDYTVVVDTLGLMRIGRFAKLTDLSPRLLRKLDERGILPPAFVDPDTGYRYYDVRQVRVGGLIHLCRQLGLPPDQTREILAAAQRGELRHHLERQREVVAAKLAQQSRLLGLLEDELSRAGQPLAYEIELRDEPAILVMSASGVIGRTHPHDPWALEEALHAVGVKVAEHIASLGEEVDVHPIVLYESDMASDDDFRFDLCFPVPRPLPESAGVICRELPATRLAYTLYRGSYDTVFNVHLELRVWVAEHGLTVTGPSRERGIVSEEDTPDQQQWVTEVALPVCASG
jgi:DNA-binding transcriptional MerR regulator